MATTFSTRFLTALALVVGLAVSPLALTSAQAISRPSKPAVVSTSTSAIYLTWGSVSGAGKYRVKYSTSSKFSKPKYRTLSSTSVELTGLSANKNYYVKVLAISRNGKSTSHYSTVREVRTQPAGGYSQLSPTGLKATPGDGSLALSWNSRGSAAYVVSWATRSDFSSASTTVVTTTSTDLTSLKQTTAYYLRVAAADSSGTALSTYSPVVSARTLNADGWSFVTPSRLATGATTRTSVALSWTAVSDAPQYRIQYSTDADMSTANYIRTGNTSCTVAGLTPGAQYYFKVRVITSDGSNLSAYTEGVTETTPTALDRTYLTPSGYQLTSSAAEKLNASWTPVGTGLTYQVEYGTDKTLGSATTMTTKTNSLAITGLTGGGTIYARVRVVDTAGNALSPATEIKSVQVADSATALRVASYNIKCTSCFSGLALEGTWYQRRDAVVANVLAHAPDVIGFQEASQAWLKDSNGKSISLSQFEDLANRLGRPYALANTNRNNCVKSTTPTNCVYKDQGASQGDKIIYNTTKLTLIKQGSKRLSEINASDNDRYVAWAIFQHKVTGKKFLFADTHLEPTSSSSALRITQTKEVLATVAANAGGLPVYVVGDFNSHKWTTPSNGPYDTMIAAGFVDPLGNTYRSTTTTRGATVQTRVRTNYSSYNGFNAKASYFSYINGTYLDYIWTSAGIQVPRWETVVNIDANSIFIGTIPSDHNLLVADTVIP